jgi:hypothetical protein
MAHGEVAVVDEFPVDPRQHVDGLLQVGIADGIALQEGVLVGIEQPAVEGGDVQRGITLVDGIEEIF